MIYAEFNDDGQMVGYSDPGVQSTSDRKVKQVEADDIRSLYRDVDVDGIVEEVGEEHRSEIEEYIDSLEEQPLNTYQHVEISDDTLSINEDVLSEVVEDKIGD